MNADAFFASVAFMLVLLNPFLLAIYLLEVIRKTTFFEFTRIMIRATAISGGVFLVFAIAGDYVFSDVLQVRFASFLVFGGIVFLLIGLKFVFEGPDAITLLRGTPERIAGAVAMPFMIGPGTINASILAGSRQPAVWACLSIVVALVITILVMVALKGLHDVASQRREELVERYIDLCGRVSALLIGTFALEMIFQGVEQWWRIIKQGS